MSVLLDYIPISGTTTSGTYSVNTLRAVHGMVRQVLLKPTTATTFYDIEITDLNDQCIYKRVSEQGQLAELTDLPLKGIATITISNATNDEAFTGYLVTQTQ